MAATDVHIGVVVTSALWGATLRGYITDHVSGVDLQVLVGRGQIPGEGDRLLDALIVDDRAQTIDEDDVRIARRHRTLVIGLYDERDGRGQAYLVQTLGVDEALPADTPPREIIAVVMRHGAVNAGTGDGYEAHREDLEADHRDHRSRPRGTRPDLRAQRVPARRPVALVSSVSGGTGRSEAIVAMGERLARTGTVLVIEAADSSLAHRLERSPDGGLNYCLERIARGQRPFPEGLSAGRQDRGPLGSFDIICGTLGSSPSPPVTEQLVSLVDLAADSYDRVIVETGPLVNSDQLDDRRLDATRALLARADHLAVFAAADPAGALKLVDWMTAAHQMFASSTPWTCAVFGRSSKRRFDRAELVRSLDVNTDPSRFDSIRFLPEDRHVERGRWDRVMVKSGPWVEAVWDLAAEGAGHRTERRPHTADRRGGRGRGRGRGRRSQPRHEPEAVRR